MQYVTQTRMFENLILLQIYLNNFLKITWSSSCDEESCCQFGNSFFWISLLVPKLNNLWCLIGQNFMPSAYLAQTFKSFSYLKKSLIQPELMAFAIEGISYKDYLQGSI